MLTFAYDDYADRFLHWRWDPYPYQIKQAIVIGVDNYDQID